MKPLFLIGYMGCGKSYIAEKLSAHINCTYIDMDREIERTHALIISEIFAQKGEDYFRQYEHKLLNQLIKRENIIVAVGGGTPCFFDNMKVIKNNGVSIYIKYSSDFLYSRLQKEKENRPLITDINDDELPDYISKQLTERELFYNQADIIIQNCNSEDIIQVIIEKIKSHDNLYK